MMVHLGSIHRLPCEIWTTAEHQRGRSSFGRGEWRDGTICRNPLAAVFTALRTPECSRSLPNPNEYHMNRPVTPGSTAAVSPEPFNCALAATSIVRRFFRRNDERKSG